METIVLAYINVGTKSPQRAKEFLAEQRASLSEQFGGGYKVVVIASTENKIVIMDGKNKAKEAFDSAIDNTFDEFVKVRDEVTKSGQDFIKKLQKAVEAFQNT